MDKYQVIVIGSGPAGYTAALYAARANLEPLLITGLNRGGQLTQSSGVENWPGAFEYPSGLDLMEKMYQHIKQFNVQCVTSDVSSVVPVDGGFKICCSAKEFETKCLIVATGSSARYLGLDSEKKFIGNGISACATCDGFFYRKKRVAVIGGGNTAITDALYLANLASQTHLVHRREEFRCEKVLTDKLMKAVQEGRIVLHLNAVVDEFLGDDFLTGLKLRNVMTSDTENLEVDGVFEAVGHTPNTGFLADLLKLNQGYIELFPDKGYATATSVDGIFAAGDVANNRYQQAIVAAGSGCMAALDVEHYLANQPS